MLAQHLTVTSAPREHLTVQTLWDHDQPLQEWLNPSNKHIQMMLPGNTHREDNFLLRFERLFRNLYM